MSNDANCAYLFDSRVGEHGELLIAWPTAREFYDGKAKLLVPQQLLDFAQPIVWQTLWLLCHPF